VNPLPAYLWHEHNWRRAASEAPLPLGDASQVRV